MGKMNTVQCSVWEGPAADEGKCTARDLQGPAALFGLTGRRRRCLVAGM